MGTDPTPRGLGRATRAAAAALVATGGVMIGAHAAQAADGDFASGPRVTVPYPYALTTGDVNRDGRADLVVATGVRPYPVRVLLGAPGGFTPAADVAGARGPSDMLLADIDRDGDEDLAIAAESVVLAVGDGAGGFTSIPGTPVTQPFALARADGDGDGRPDLAISGSTALSVRAGAVGIFGLPVFNESASFATELGSVITGDVNGDGRDDVLVGDYLKPVLHVHLGQGAGRFAAAADVPLPGASSAPHNLATGDIDGDGRLDVVAMTKGGTVVLRGTPQGGLTEAARLTIQATGTGSVAVGDFDHDGRDDVLTGLDLGYLRLHRSTGGFTFADSESLLPGQINDMAVADYDGDGTDDVAIATAAEVRVLLGTSGPARPGNLVAGGGFESPTTAWTAAGGASVVPYGSAIVAVPSRDESPRFGTGGLALAAGGPGASSLVQTIDVSRRAALIDAGGATATLSAYLGGARTAPAAARVTATMPGATVDVGPVTAADRGNLTTLVRRTAAVRIPRGTRAITVRVGMPGGAALADNVALTIDETSPDGSGRTPGTGGPGGGAAGGRDAFGPRTLVTLAPLSGRPVRVRVRNGNGFSVTGRITGAGAPRAFRVAAHRSVTVRLRPARRHPPVLRLRARVTDPSGTTRTVVRRLRVPPAAPRR